MRTCFFQKNPQKKGVRKKKFEKTEKKMFLKKQNKSSHLRVKCFFRFFKKKYFPQKKKGL
jgi:hypothetical protein